MFSDLSLPATFDSDTEPATPSPTPQVSIPRPLCIAPTIHPMSTKNIRFNIAAKLRRNVPKMILRAVIKLHFTSPTVLDSYTHNDIGPELFEWISEELRSVKKSERNRDNGAVRKDYVKILSMMLEKHVGTIVLYSCLKRKLEELALKSTAKPEGVEADKWAKRLASRQVNITVMEKYVEYIEQNCDVKA